MPRFPYRRTLQVQQLRHEDIRTTMNIYTRAVPERLREANSKIVSILLPTGTAWGLIAPLCSLAKRKLQVEKELMAEACGSRKQYRSEFQGLRRNAGER